MVRVASGLLDVLRFRRLFGSLSSGKSNGGPPKNGASFESRTGGNQPPANQESILDNTGLVLDSDWTRAFPLSVAADCT